MASLRAAVVGLGFGGAHASAYKTNPRTQLELLCDTDQTKLAASAAQFDVKATTTRFEDVVAAGSVDLVSLATPDHLHAEQAVSLLRAGKHVLCEKPMAVSHEQLQQMIAAAEDSGKKLYIGHETRLVPMFQQAKRLIEDGTIGRVFHAESCYVHNVESLARGRWRADPTRPQDAMLGGGCHPVDLLLHLLGPIDEAFAYSNHFNNEVLPQDDCIVALYRFRSGATARVLVTLAAKAPYRLDLHLYGTAATLACNNEDETGTLWRGDSDGRCDADEIRAPGMSHPVQDELDLFVESVLADSNPFVDAYQGAAAAAACLAAVESSRSGQPEAVRRYDPPMTGEGEAKRGPGPGPAS